MVAIIELRGGLIGRMLMMSAMRKKRYDDKLHLDMGFAETMERFAGVKPSEMHANIRGYRATRHSSSR
jgi:hypothetical protein